MDPPLNIVIWDKMNEQEQFNQLGLNSVEVASISQAD